MRFLAKFEPQGYVLLRIVTGLLFLWHGTSKLFSYPVPPKDGIPAFVKYGAGGIEPVGGVMAGAPISSARSRSCRITRSTRRARP